MATTFNPPHGFYVIRIYLLNTLVQHPSFTYLGQEIIFRPTDVELEYLQ